MYALRTQQTRSHRWWRRRGWIAGLLVGSLGLAGGCASHTPEPDRAPPPMPPPQGVDRVPVEQPAETAPADAAAASPAAEAHIAAQGHFDAGRFAEAVTEAERATTLAPAEARHHLLLGRALSERIHQLPVFNKLPMARRIEAAFLRAVELDPASIEGQTALARYYSEAPPIAGGDVVKAEHHARLLLELDPLAGHRMLAKLFDLWKRPDEAAKHRAAAEALDGS